MDRRTIIAIVASLGIYYARQRFYDPQLGRFLNQDPIGFRGGLNTYSYCENSPTNRVDPNGLDGWDVAKGFGKAVVGAVLIAGAVAASGIEIPAAAAWGLGALGMGYGTCKLATGKEPFTGREIDVHEWDETAGGLIPFPLLPPAGYNGAASTGANLFERAMIIVDPRNWTAS